MPKGDWHEYRACYERVQRGGGDKRLRTAQRGELMVKAKNEREAHEKAVHLLHAAGVRYQFRLTLKRIEPAKKRLPNEYEETEKE